MIKRFVTVASFVVLLAVLAACGGDDKPSPAATPAFPGATWQLEYTISGGIAGNSQRLTLDSKGSITTEDKRAARTRQGFVAASAVSTIGGLASSLETVKSDQGLPRPDAILTSVKVTSGDKSFGTTFNTAPTSPPDVAALMQRLAKLYEDNRP